MYASHKKHFVCDLAHVYIHVRTIQSLKLIRKNLKYRENTTCTFTCNAWGPYSWQGRLPSSYPVIMNTALGAGYPLLNS